jgi:alanyl-tRNA synthetase
MNTIDIRENFITYFRNQKHKYLNPTKVFNDDPTLFFVNAGMNQLKPIFLGTKEFDEKYSMLVNCQTCIRAGGKHNDFDDVGKDTYHLTSFGMLGNWSLNNYWKEEAINLAFRYLVDVCKFDVSRMYATYFGGNDEIPADNESKEIWKKYLSESHIVAGSFKDNFWMMGDTGPCGACTEIHYDLENRSDMAHLVNMSDPTLIEVWNLVFMEYNATTTKYTHESHSDEPIKCITTSYTKLDKRFVDTGMGLERLAMIMQNKKSLYQIDIFKKLMSYAQILSSGEEYTDDYDLENKKGYCI